MADREKRMRQLAWAGAAFIAASAILLQPPTSGIAAAVGILLTVPYFYDEYGDRIRARLGSK